MPKHIWIYSLIAGAIILSTTVLAIELEASSLWLGYLVMLIAFCLIFVAVKQHRDEALGGVIRFGPALLIGLSITLLAGAIYVLGWECYLWATDYALVGFYVDGGLTAYGAPLPRMGITFLEILPAGVLVSLISAAVLRRPEILPADPVSRA